MSSLLREYLKPDFLEDLLDDLTKLFLPLGEILMPLHQDQVLSLILPIEKLLKQNEFPL